MVGGGSGSTMVIVLPPSTSQSTVDNSAQGLRLTFTSARWKVNSLEAVALSSGDDT